MTEAKRQEIKDRLSASQERNAAREQGFMELVGETATAVKDEVTDFAKKHPVATVAGAVMVGVLISAMFKNSPTRRAGHYAGAKAAGLATLGGEVAASLLAQVIEGTAHARQAGADRLEDMGDAISDTTRRVRREAGYRAGNAGDAARTTARDLGKAIARSIRR